MPYRPAIWVALLGVLLAACPLSAALPAPQGATMLQPFDYHGVTLDDGDLRRQVEEVRAYYLRIPNDDLLRPYRLRAGKPAPGVDLGGLYLSHHPFGQIISGLARFYAATGDERCKGKAEALLAGWAECIEPDGFFFAVRAPQLVPYHYDKMVCALVDLAAYCGSKQAISCLGRITDWAAKHMSRERRYTDVTSPHGGEWYTLSENLYRAYLLTGDPRYRDFARVWEYREYWGCFAAGRSIFGHPQPHWYHAYSHVNTLSSLAAAYLVNGDPADLAALRHAYDFLWQTQLWATGGYGPNESLLPRPELARLLGDSSTHFETQCGSWAGFKLTRYLIGFTGDARYGDWTELLVTNGIGASIPMSPRGHVFYYADYNPGGAEKHNLPEGWACCSGTRPQAVADYHNLIYFHAPGRLYVNLFAASTVEWRPGEGAIGDRDKVLRLRAAGQHSAQDDIGAGGAPGGEVTVVQRTRFPEEDTARFTIHTDRPRRFGLNIRRPAWLARPAVVTLNGQPFPVRPNARHWLAIERQWRDGDNLTVRLPMSWRLHRADPDREYPAALTYGPVTMVARAEGGGNPSRSLDLRRLAATMRPVPGQPLSFRPAGDPSVLVRPFYQVPEGERYFMYLDPVRCPLRVPYRELTYSPGWAEFPAWMATNQVGSSAECTLEAEHIKIQGFRYDDAGTMAVTSDGKPVGVIDEYGPHRGEPASWTFDLGPGRHVVRLTLLADRNPASKGQYVNLAAIEGEQGGR